MIYQKNNMISEEDIIKNAKLVIDLQMESIYKFKDNLDWSFVKVIKNYLKIVVR